MLKEINRSTPERQIKHNLTIMEGLQRPLQCSQRSATACLFARAMADCALLPLSPLPAAQVGLFCFAATFSAFLLAGATLVDVHS